MPQHAGDDKCRGDSHASQSAVLAAPSAMRSPIFSLLVSHSVTACVPRGGSVVAFEASPILDLII